MDEERRYDAVFDEAWLEFTEHLADCLAGLDPDEPLIVPVSDDAGPGSPRLRFVKLDGDSVIGGVSSNQTLSAAHRLSSRQIDQLLDLGWTAPTPPGDRTPIPDFYLVFAGSRTAADAAVSTLRVVFSVPHPDFLRPAPNEAELHGEAPVDPHAGEQPLPVDEAYHPSSPGDLAWAVSQVLRNHLGSYRAPDERGCFSVRMGSSALLIRPDPRGHVSVVAFVVTHVRFPDVLGPVIRHLDDDSPYVRFRVSDDRVLATCDIPAVPFVPRHLHTVIDTVSELLDEVAAELATACGGRTVFGDDPDRGIAAGVPVDASDDEAVDSDELPEELLTILQLDAEGTAELDPPLVASIMGHDRSLVLSCIRLSEEQQISWTTSAEEAEQSGQPDADEEAAACRHEARAWDATVALLREALYVVVTAGSVGDVTAGRGADAPDAEPPFFTSEPPHPSAHDIVTAAISELEPGDRLFVHPRGLDERPWGFVVEVLRYLDDGLIARVHSTQGPGAWTDPMVEDLLECGWLSVTGTTPPGGHRFVYSLCGIEDGAPRLAGVVLHALWEYVDVPPDGDDVVVTATHPAGRPTHTWPHAVDEVSSPSDLAERCAEVIASYGGEPVLFATERQTTPFARGSVTITVDPSDPVVHLRAPVVTDLRDVDLATVQGAMCASAFAWCLTGPLLEILADVPCDPFSPSALGAALEAADDIILALAGPIARVTGGVAVIDAVADAATDVDDHAAERDDAEVDDAPDGL